MDLHREKKFLRRKYFDQLKINNNKSINDLSLKNNLYRFFHLTLSVPKRERKIMIYRPMQSEIDINVLTKNYKNVQWYYPYYYRKKLFAENRNKIYEVWQMDYIITPGLYVDKEGYRLGRGGGFYDRLLAFYPRERAVFVAYDWQFIDKIPHEAHDRRIGTIITERNIIKP